MLGTYKKRGHVLENIWKAQLPIVLYSLNFGKLCVFIKTFVL